MSLTSMLILFGIAISFLLCFHGALWLFKKHQKQEASLLMITPFVLMGLFVLLSIVVAFLIQNSFNMQMIVFLSFAVVTTLSKYCFKKESALLFILFSVLGFLIMPQNGVPFERVALFSLPVACLSYLITKAAYLFNRIPLFGAFSFIAYFIGGAFLSFLNVVSDEAYFLSVAALFSIPTVAYMLKSVQCFSLKDDMVTFLSFCFGFIVLELCVKGCAFVLPIFFGYEIFELLLAFYLTVTIFKSFKSLQIPFLIERVFMTGFLPIKALRKVFFMVVTLVLLACLATGIQETKYKVVAYIFAGVLIYNTYLVFLRWGLPEPKLRTLLGDVKKGFSTLESHLFKNSVKKGQSEAEKPLLNENNDISSTETIQSEQQEKKADNLPVLKKKSSLTKVASKDTKTTAKKTSVKKKKQTPQSLKSSIKVKTK